jgi:hypothetical protein
VGNKAPELVSLCFLHFLSTSSIKLQFLFILIDF